MNPVVTKVHGKEKRWSAEYAALRQLCLASGLNEELKWGQACYDFQGGNVVFSGKIQNGTWATTWGLDPNTTSKNVSMDVPATIVLVHNPDAADVSVWGGFEGWILCGHTHGGQCKPPFLPPPLLPVRNKRYVSGEIALSQNRRMYISRGVGHLLQVRFNARPEIPIFRLFRA